jgi:hypothetical protein
MRAGVEKQMDDDDFLTGKFFDKLSIFLALPDFLGSIL